MTFPAPIKIEVCTTDKQMHDAFRVREVVFVEEYGYKKEELVHNAWVSCFEQFLRCLNDFTGSTTTHYKCWLRTAMAHQLDHVDSRHSRKI